MNSKFSTFWTFLPLLDFLFSYWFSWDKITILPRTMFYFKPCVCMSGHLCWQAGSCNTFIKLDIDDDCGCLVKFGKKRRSFYLVWKIMMRTTEASHVALEKKSFENMKIHFWAPKNSDQELFECRQGNILSFLCYL